MTREEVKKLKKGMYVCYLPYEGHRNDGRPGDDMRVGKPVRVTRITSRGVCTGTNENKGKHYVIFVAESPLIDGCVRGGSCYGGDWYHVRPNILQVRAWRQGMTWREFKKAGIFRK